jgi:AcrR family transcriptional regulator
MNKPASPEKKAAKADRIIEKAVPVILEKNIGEVRMEDLAPICDVGVATLYRYFPTKDKLVIACGKKIWDNMYADLYNSCQESAAENKNGFETVKSAIMKFKNIFHEHAQAFVFFHDFDQYVMRREIKPNQLMDYEKSILTIHDIFMKIIVQGRQDGSIRDGFDADSLYFTMARSLIGLCYRMLMQNTIIMSDSLESADQQLAVFMDAILYYIQKR